MYLVFILIEQGVLMFSTAPDWTVDSNKGQVPLAIEVISNGRVKPYFTRTVKQRYDFYEFYSNIRPDYDILEVSPPPGNDR